MKQLFYITFITILLTACKGQKSDNTQEELAKLKRQKATIDAKILKLEAKNPEVGRKATPVTAVAIYPEHFTSYIEVQAVILGDENVIATPQASGIVLRIYVRPGDLVQRGQLLASLDANVVEQQIRALEPQLALQKALYEKQKSLWAENIGTEVQLLSAQTQYEATQKQRNALRAQKNLYRIIAPISGIVDEVPIREGDMVSPGMTGIRIVNSHKLKAEASLGENYLGMVKQGNMVTLIFPGGYDSIRTRLSYVAQSVDPISRAFRVQIRLGANSRLHPNMSCKMKIANYNNDNALVVPIPLIQKTAQGEMLFIVDGDKAKAVTVTTGRTSSGKIEVLSGLQTGDKVITEGYEDLDNGEPIKLVTF